MNNKELEKEYSMSYYELLAYLKKKYKAVPHNYFRNETCKSKDTRNSRTAEGLFIHHDFEYDPDDDRVCDLSKLPNAILWPWKYQLAENLTYCNWLEHLIIHIKINLLRAKQCDGYITDGVENFLVPDLNRMYRGDFDLDTLPDWKLMCFTVIEDDYEDYCTMVTEWLVELGYPTANWKNW